MISRVLWRSGLTLIAILTSASLGWTPILQAVESPSQIFRLTAPLGLASFRTNLRFDGLYQSEKVEDCWYYLRFYDDGTVISVSSTGKHDKVAAWFNKKHSNVSRGNYVITGTRIVFTTSSESGKVEFDGALDGEQIQFRVFSRINNSKRDEKYKFVNVELK